MMVRLRERTWRFWLAVAALLALAGGIVYIALNWYEIADRSDYQGMQGEALTNPYLAMQRTLGAMGAKMETIKGSAAWDQALLEQLPAGSVREIQYAPPGATLFLGDRRLARMRDKRVTQLREWVRAGGNLIIEAEQPKLDDPLLQSYGIGHVGLRITKEGKWVERRAPNRGKIPDSEKNAKNSKGAEAADEENDPPQDDEPEDTDFTSDEDDTVSQNLLKLAAKLRDSVTSTIEFPDDTEFKVSFKPYQNLKLIKRSKLPENAVVIDDEIGARWEKKITRNSSGTSPQLSTRPSPPVKRREFCWPCAIPVPACGNGWPRTRGWR
jgi:hypothetical protein